MVGYDGDVVVEVQPVQWGVVILFGMVLALFAPFGFRAWRNLSDEIEGARAFGSGRRRSGRTASSEEL
jgi:hypothetical protein